MTPENLHDALSLGMALRRHWQETKGETISDHEPFHVYFEGDRIVVRDRGRRGTFESVCTSGHRFVRCCCQGRECTGWRAAVTPGPQMSGIVP